MQVKTFIFIFVVAVFQITFISELSGCSQGVAMGVVTTDGRPMIWHNLDYYLSGYTYSFKKSSGSPYDHMGVYCNNYWIFSLHLNKAGFARTQNTFSGTDNKPHPNESRIYWLENFDTVSDIRFWIKARPDTTYDDILGFMGQEAGESVVVFEVSDSFTSPNYWEYNPANSTRQSSGFPSPYLFAVRSNGGFTDRDHLEPTEKIAAWTESSKIRFENHIREIRSAIAGDNKLSVKEVFNALRYGDSGVSGQPYVVGPGGPQGTSQSISVSIALGVKATDDPKYATFLFAPGHAEYNIPVPVWVSLDSSDFSTYITSANTSTNSIMYWVHKYFNDYVRGSDGSLDTYMRAVLDPLEDNILDGVSIARNKWFQFGDQTDFMSTLKEMHSRAAWCVYKTIYSVYKTADGSGKNCNDVPLITSLNVKSASGKSINCSATATDSDGIMEYSWKFGDGSSNVTGPSVSHTYSKPGTYMVSVIAKDKRLEPAANLKFKWVTVNDVSPVLNSPTGLQIGQ